MINVTQYRSLIDKSKGKLSAIQKQLEEAKTKRDLLMKRHDAILFAQTLIQKAAQQTQEGIRVHLEDIVQKCLDTVFPDEYTFKMEFPISRNKTEVRLKFFVDGDETDPMEQEGGGLVDIASLGLRIAAWTLSGSTNTILFDESMKFLSKDLQPRGAEVLKELSHALNLQFIFVSHSPEIIAVADKVINVELKKEMVNGISRRVSRISY